MSKLKSKEARLREIQWHSPESAESLGGLHSNTILFYFSFSPFFERTSNNAVIFSQAQNNQTMFHLIQTREAFEGHLKTMKGLQFVVAEEPAESGPGAGTGVWVIRKQTRQVKFQEEEIIVHAYYFIVGLNIYMAPTMADLLATKIMMISSAISQALTTAESIKRWQASTGHVYQLPGTATAPKATKTIEAKAETPLPDATGKPATATASKNDETSLEKLIEESYWIHMKYGGDYIDENPITGRPGEFHLSSTGRKPVPPPKAVEQTGIGAISGPKLNTKIVDKKDGKEKSPKSATMPKLKRKKSRGPKGTPSAAATPVATTPAASF
ncbi:unnamed protein product [Clonostachys byssicola]|uniref:Mediator of RNA polymerase II transcription subunit 6 n=1 Tax=Clonostachys byssicola TaxID=160290 RepID=A0A9N9YDX3_9HYPO|nr:unnamed protein product [Clonostachys byssicola]